MRDLHIMPSARLVTAAELERIPKPDGRRELVAGRVIEMSPVGFQHGRVVARLLLLLGRHLQDSGRGVALTEVGFKLASDPDTVRAPDVAFVRQPRVPADERGFFHGPPDLAIEVLSPDDRPSEVRVKVDEYLSSGVPLVIVFDPDGQSATCYRRLLPPTTLSDGDDVLDAGDVVAGFHCRLADVFAA